MRCSPRLLLSLALPLISIACAAPVGESESDPQNPFVEGRFEGGGKADGSSILSPAWEPPRTLRVGDVLEDQAVSYDIALGPATESNVQQHVEEDGDVVVEIDEERPGEVELEFGSYYLQLEHDGPVSIEAVPEQEGYEARFAVKGPIDDAFHSHEGNELVLDDAIAGRTKVAVIPGVMPDFRGSFRYRLTVARLAADEGSGGD